MLVRKLDHTGREVWRYPAAVLRQEQNLIVVEAYFNRDDMNLGYTIFKRGDRFVEYFYSDRWYNVFAVHDRDDGELKGWYCNVCRPAFWDDQTIACEDLALDVWVDPAGRSQVMDEDEFAASPLKDGERLQARQALADLLDLGQTQQLPR